MPTLKQLYSKEKSQLLAALLVQAGKKGFIQSETILEKFARYRLNEEEKEDIFLEFENAGIRVVFPDSLTDSFLEDANDISSDDEVSLPKELDDTEYNGTLDSVHQYLREIHRFPLLTNKETLRLVRLVQDGDTAARETLINCNLRFAFSMATKYTCTGLPLLDLVQQANIGLMSAVDRYNPNRGTKFTTYSVFWIKQAILSYIEDQSRLIKLPGYITTALKKIKTVQDDYYREHRSYPSDDEVATLTGFSIARIKHLTTLECSVASLDSPTNDEMDGTLLDTVRDENNPDPLTNITAKEQRDIINYYLNQLSPRDKQILTLRFGLGDQRHHNLEETGQIMNLTPERVRQIESMALNKIRNMKSSNVLRKYMKP